MSEVVGHTLYETDYYAWTQEQAAALRKLAEQRANVPLDLVNLAEEVEDLGRSQRDAVRSQIRRIIEHLLKLQFSRAADPRGEWEDTIDDARNEFGDKITATLRRDVDEMLPDLYRQARRKTARGLRRFGETDAADALPASCPYALDDILRDDWYPVNRHGLDGGDAPAP